MEATWLVIFTCLVRRYASRGGVLRGRRGGRGGLRTSGQGEGKIRWRLKEETVPDGRGISMAGLEMMGAERLGRR